MSYAIPAYLAYCDYCVRHGKRFTWLGYGRFKRAWEKRQAMSERRDVR